MIVIAGLGNPGRRYQRTRHNVGFRVVDAFADSAGAIFTHSERDNADIATTRIGRKTCLVVKPQTYMNLSGVAVQRILQRVSRNNPKLIVVYDDKDLPFSRLRVRSKGSSGGHRGVQSILDVRGEHFTRIRIGVANPTLAKIETERFVTQPFTSSEEQQLPDVIQKALEILEKEIRGQN